MAKQLHEKILNALDGRGVWEERQQLFYQMRHEGLRRRTKPFRGAADLHLPIGDNAVSKLKPYYINSIFGRQRLASFTPLRTQLASATAGAADFLDWKLRNETNFALEMAYVIDAMLVCGNPVLKLRWDPTAADGFGGVVFECVDPLFFVVPSSGDEIDEMDWFCHIRQTTVAKYLRDDRYEHSADLVARIRGGDKQVEHWKEQEKQGREGLTYSQDEDEIVLFECYERVSKGWKVRTISPSAPNDPVREDFILGYKWRGQPMQPFTKWRVEITEKGFYAPRGVIEQVAPYETYGTKLWNAKADWLEYSMKPLFTRTPDAAMANTANITLKPGEMLPPGVAPAAMPEPPFAISEEIQNTRQLAEESAGTPDFGIQQQNEGGKAGNRTATEWNYLGSFAGQGIQLKAWITAQSEGQVYRKAWALYCQFSKEELAYFQSGTRKVLPEQAKHDQYLIEPDAQPDAWNKQQRMQRSVARFQMLKGHPNVNQEELVKTLLEDDDARLVKKLFISSGNKAATESEDEAIEISALLLEGYPAAVLPGEDHATRLKILFGKLQQLALMPPPNTQEELMRATVGRQRMHEHIGQHLQMLQQENPALAKQIIAAMQTLDAGMGGQQAAAGGGMMPQQTETLSSGGEPSEVSGSMMGRMSGGLAGVQTGQPVPDSMAV